MKFIRDFNFIFMKKLYYILILFLVMPGLHAQVLVKGRVVDEGNNPVIGANIYINNTYDGSSTDPQGEFKFKTDARGPQQIVVSMVGYKEQRMKVNLDTLKGPLLLSMKEDIKRLDDLVITAGVFEASDEKKSVALKPIDIVTTAGATADIAGVLNTMPGTQTVGEKGRLFVRGGEDSETKNFIDGVLVDNIYGLTPDNVPSRMRFSPFLFSGTAFSTGGYSAEYGQALSGTLVLKSDNTPPQSQTDLSFMTVGGSIAHTQKWKGGSIYGETYYLNLRPYFVLVPQTRDWKKPPRSWENNFMLRQDIGKFGHLKVFYSNDFSRMSIMQPSMLDVHQDLKTRLSNDYHYLNINYNVITDNNWSFYYGISDSYLKDTTSMEIYSIRHRQHSLHSKMMADYDPGNRFGIKFGVDQYFLDYKEKLNYDLQDFRYSNSFNDWIPGVFAESNIYLTDKFIGRIGVREEYSSMSGKFMFSPRLSLAYKTGKYSQFSFATGKFNQRPLPDYLVINDNLKDETAEHYILNYQVTKTDRTFRIEAYRKSYSDLVCFDTINSFIPSQYNNNGHGYANGIDFFWRDSHTIPNGDYWISYSLIDTKRLFRDYPVEAIPQFVSTHNLSVVYKQFFSKLKSQLGVTYTFASGRPYNNPNSDKFNDGTTPVFHDLSMNWSYLIKTNIILHFSATNILGRDNVFGYQYSEIPDEQGHYDYIPVKQGAKRFLFLGLFITLSKDNKTNQIRNL